MKIDFAKTKQAVREMLDAAIAGFSRKHRGVVFLTEGVWVDYFEYHANPHASVPFDFPVESFELGVKNK